jgi:hypothetical protein
LRDHGGHSRRLGFDLLRGESENTRALHFEPVVSSGIALDLPGLLVNWAVDLDAELCRRAIEVEDVGSERVLTSKTETKFTAAKHRPQRPLGPGHDPAQTTRALKGLR